MPFRDIAGHRHLIELLSSAVVRGSLPPSLIFAGPVGVGKLRAAIALAQTLNCLTRPNGGADACGTCAACTRIARGVHADVLLIQPGDTGAIKVDQIRDAIERAAYRPFEGRRRVVIIDDADEILVEAQNALLKTLEEPPPASTFVLVTSRPDVLLPTVRSRCQRLRFGRLAPAEIAEVLILTTSSRKRRRMPRHPPLMVVLGRRSTRLPATLPRPVRLRPGCSRASPRARIPGAGWRARRCCSTAAPIETSLREGFGPSRRCCVTLASCYPARTNVASRMLT